ncbi:MarR family transcriptional regulator [Marinobacter arenosus]|uniref:MarR family transcriptional regulator n=1 Tax=Marinobacter arenosus TaxID=2856822 RepID=UPI001C4CF77D|nr:helix-turn-helix domain-containing protein [Marinobacter arenosus]MBW0146997.1 hypothetical protein [Marinobacter arenosus]
MEQAKPPTQPLCLPGGLVPMDQWAIPEISVRRTVKDMVRHILVQLRVGISPEEEPFQSLDELPALSETQLQRIAPDPDFSALARELASQLRESQTGTPNPRDVAFLVAPPFSGLREALGLGPRLEANGHAKTEPCTVIAPPENLLMSEEEARHWWDTQDLSRPWVIPELADFWLRHMAGLALVREFFRRISAGEAGQGIVGCSSWFWQFWASYLPNMHVGPWTPAPLSASGLSSWLTYLAEDNGGSPVIARMTHDGLYVLPADGLPGSKKIKHSGFLGDLAATARGNPGVALAIWRKALRARPEDEADADADTEGPAPARSQHCWVVPLDQLSLPTMPQGKGPVLGMVLHALLLHDGLDEASLGLVTGVSAHELSHTLARLARAEMVRRSESGGSWHVTDLGYPGTRRHLQSWGFPVDGF